MQICFFYILTLLSTASAHAGGPPLPNADNIYVRLGLDEDLFTIHNADAPLVLESAYAEIRTKYDFPGGEKDLAKFKDAYDRIREKDRSFQIERVRQITEQDFESLYWHYKRQRYSESYSYFSASKFFIHDLFVEVDPFWNYKAPFRKAVSDFIHAHMGSYLDLNNNPAPRLVDLLYVGQFLSEEDQSKYWQSVLEYPYLLPNQRKVSELMKARRIEEAFLKGIADTRSADISSEGVRRILAEERIWWGRLAEQYVIGKLAGEEPEFSFRTVQLAHEAQKLTAESPSAHQQNVLVDVQEALVTKILLEQENLGFSTTTEVMPGSSSSISNLARWVQEDQLSESRLPAYNRAVAAAKIDVCSRALRDETFPN